MESDASECDAPTLWSKLAGWAMFIIYEIEIALRWRSPPLPWWMDEAAGVLTLALGEADAPGHAAQQGPQPGWSGECGSPPSPDGC